jgi:hypothetical protein
MYDVCIYIYIWKKLQFSHPLGQFGQKNEKASNLTDRMDKYSRIDRTIDRTFTMSCDDQLD